LLIKSPPYWQPALAGGAEVINSAAISSAANAPTMQRFMVVSRHNAAGELPSAWGGKTVDSPCQQPMTLPPIYLVIAAFEVVIRSIGGAAEQVVAATVRLDVGRMRRPNRIGHGVVEIGFLRPPPTKSTPN
jgi:hypothetical protein